MKHAPEGVRGSSLMIYQCSMCIGFLAFNGSAGIMFDLIGPSTPFVVIGCLDFLFALYTVVSHMLGHLFNGPEFIGSKKK